MVGRAESRSLVLENLSLSFTSREVGLSLCQRVSVGLDHHVVIC